MHNGVTEAVRRHLHLRQAEAERFLAPDGGHTGFANVNSGTWTPRSAGRSAGEKETAAGGSRLGRPGRATSAIPPNTINWPGWYSAQGVDFR
jgi:hypothetical protein